MLRIAIQSKGRLYEETIRLLEESGVRLNKNKRSLLVPASGFPAELLFLRDDDIPQSVAKGIADAGIIGENEYVEKGSGATLVKRLGFSRCRLSLAIPKDAEYESPQWFNGKTIATSYPSILADYLQKHQITAEINVISGSVEISPRIGIADAIFDIVSSGSTLLSNQLREVETVMHSEALLISSPNLGKEKEDVLGQLVFRFNAVLAAEGKKYVLLNAPEAAVEEIIKLLPGMKSPTVTPLADKQWVAVQSVIDENRFWDIIGKLKTLGAEDILILPIEKMIV
ncbi:MAG: ATP phosphoribosyltransferase [Tannerellaceae bacterium]|jgi:ATP phosphoribosyltransferase|nr:ATP phosphoribosyltransferase [Tannerellaceae bacterium]